MKHDDDDNLGAARAIILGALMGLAFYLTVVFLFSL
jgi:hypothetical protein